MNRKDALFVSSSPQQDVVCCMGQPVAGNPMQFMMERAFAAASLDWRYLTFEISPEELADAIRGMRVMRFSGGNLSTPHKVTVIPLLDSLSEVAGWVGAVNSVRRQKDKLVGENTEGKGFVQSLRELIDPADKQIVILGAGHVARAIAVELGLAHPAEITIVNRTEYRGHELVTLLNERVKAKAKFSPWQADYEIPPETDIIINATSIGAGNANNHVAVNIATLLPSMIAADVTINPPRTRFLRDAEGRGCKTLDGLGMLVNQAAIDFKIWTGASPDPRVLREALEEYLEV